MRFGRGTIASAGELLGEGDTLLTTPRAEAAAPGVVAAAGTVHHVRPGAWTRSPRSSARPCRATCGGVGGGRVIDVTKALAAVAGTARPRRGHPHHVSAAEMAPPPPPRGGRAAGTPNVRAAIVINDPELSASQPLDELAASAANSSRTRSRAR